MFIGAVRHSYTRRSYFVLHRIKLYTQSSQLARFSTYKTNYKTNNIISKLHRLRAFTFERKRCSDLFCKTWLKNSLFHTHVSSKSNHIVAFREIKIPGFAHQCYYNRWSLVRPQLICYLFSFYQIRIFIFPNNKKKLYYSSSILHILTSSNFRKDSKSYFKTFQ